MLINTLTSNGLSGEILVADNGSSDGSIEIAKRLGARVVNVPVRGYGAALAHGIANAQGAWVIMGDSDDSYDFSRIELFIAKLREGYDLVMGNRFKGGIAPGAMPPLHRYVGNPVLSFIGRLFFDSPIGDFHCGLRAFSREKILALNLQSTGMEYASEMVVRATLADLKIAEVPTTLSPDGRSRKPHLRTWRDGWRHLKFLLMFSPRWLYIIPGTVLVGAGSALALLLFWGPIRLISVALDLNSFIAACFLCVVGMQFIVTGAIARQYSARAGYLPWSHRAKHFNRLITPDRLSIASLGFILCGLGLFCYPIILWAQAGFGALNNPRAPRAVLAGLTLLVIGLQLFSSAFLTGILQIPNRQSMQANPEIDAG